MTADVELPPLPPLCIAPSVEPVDYPNVAQALMDYARACVAHATAAKDAEIEALKSDLGDYMDAANYQAARAERLAEALRMMVENADDLVAYRHDEDDVGDRPCCQVASYEPHADHCPTHIARAALRDHDKGARNG